MTTQISKQKLTIPPVGGGVAETQLDFPHSFKPVAMTYDYENEDGIFVHYANNSEKELHSERFLVVEGDVDLDPIMKGQPWTYRGTVQVPFRRSTVKNKPPFQERVFYIWMIMSTAEREAKMAQEKIMRAQQEAMLDAMENQGKNLWTPDKQQKAPGLLLK